MLMTYDEFKQHILQVIQNKLGPSVRVTIQEILKNNNTHLDGLTILSGQLNISPTIYLNYYYQQYQKGKELPDIYQEILTSYKENCPTENIDISFFTEYDKVKDHIVFKLINYERNRELLTRIPHYRFLDLAIVFCCLIEASTEGCATILIHNHHLPFWNIGKEDLYALSMTNTPKLLSYDLRNMSEVLKGLFEDSPFDMACNPVPMYVLSNRNKLNGSGCILYHDLLRSFSHKLESDLYILPSSVHEVLLIPAYEKDSSMELSEMVREVNATQLANEEILSDHVYYYSRETNQLTM